MTAGRSMESMLLGGDLSSSDESDNETPTKQAKTAPPAASATVQQKSPSPLSAAAFDVNQMEPFHHQHASVANNKKARAPPAAMQQQSQALNTPVIDEDRFIFFTKALLRYLRVKDRTMHDRATAVIDECTKRNRQKVPGHENLYTIIEQRLRQVVSQQDWNTVADQLARVYSSPHQSPAQDQTKKRESPFRQQFPQAEKAEQKKKEGSERAKKQVEPMKPSVENKTTTQLLGSGFTDTIQASTTHVAMPKHTTPAKPRQKPPIERGTSTPIQANTAKVEKHKQTNKAAKPRKKPTSHQKPSTVATSNAASANVTHGAKPQKKATLARKSSTESTSTTTLVSTQAGTAKVKTQPEREYHELMELVDHAVDYNWTTASLLLGKEAKCDVDLNREQWNLLYSDNKGPSRSGPATRTALSGLTRGWSERNVLSARAAWARICQGEFEMNTWGTDPKYETMAELKSYTTSTTSESAWVNEEKAEENKTLALLSEGTQIYLKTILEKAIKAARQRQNLDGLRLWHLQHGPSNPPMSLRLGCDVRRQVAQNAGNAAKTVQRMEEALERQPARQLPNNDSLFEASSMSDFALCPKLAWAVEKADRDGKRRFAIHGGKDSGAAPFGRVPKKPKIIAVDFRLASEWADYEHQRRGFASRKIRYTGY